MSNLFFDAWSEGGVWAAWDVAPPDMIFEEWIARLSDEMQDAVEDTGSFGDWWDNPPQGPLPSPAKVMECLKVARAVFFPSIPGE